MNGNSQYVMFLRVLCGLCYLSALLFLFLDLPFSAKAVYVIVSGLTGAAWQTAAYALGLLEEIKESKGVRATPMEDAARKQGLDKKSGRKSSTEHAPTIYKL